MSTTPTPTIRKRPEPHTSNSLPPLPVISQVVLNNYSNICARIKLAELRIATCESTIEAHQEQTGGDADEQIALAQLEITATTAELWWWLNLQNEIVTRAGLDKLLGALEEGRLSSAEFLEEVAQLTLALKSGTATLR